MNLLEISIDNFPFAPDSLRPRLAGPVLFFGLYLRGLQVPVSSARVEESGQISVDFCTCRTDLHADQSCAPGTRLGFSNLRVDHAALSHCDQFNERDAVFLYGLHLYASPL